MHDGSEMNVCPGWQLILGLNDCTALFLEFYFLRIYIVHAFCFDLSLSVVISYCLYESVFAFSWLGILLVN